MVDETKKEESVGGLRTRLEKQRLKTKLEALRRIEYIANNILVDISKEEVELVTALSEVLVVLEDKI